MWINRCFSRDAIDRAFSRDMPPLKPHLAADERRYTQMKTNYYVGLNLGGTTCYARCEAANEARKIE
jgi:hypothetical protein